MTRDEILRLPAGPEMDALVAERVMGWHRGEGRTADSWYNASLECVAPAEDSELDMWDGSCANCDSAWSPSTRISNAWEVVEKLQARGVRLHYSSDGWHFGIGYTPPSRFMDDPPDPEEWEVECCAPTAPLAICRAALLAVMGV